MGPTRIWRIGALFLLTVGLLSAGAAGSRAAHAGLGAHLERGTCEGPGETIAEMELGYREPVLGTPAATPTGSFSQPDPQGAVPVVTGTVEIDSPADQLVATPHVVRIVLVSDAEGAGEPVELACGLVGGIPAEDDLVFGLRSLGVAEACTTGIAWLHEVENGSRLTIFASQGLCPEDDSVATPVAVQA